LLTRNELMERMVLRNARARRHRAANLVILLFVAIVFSFFFFSFFVITSRPYTERLRMFFFLLFALANFGSNIKAAKPTDLLSELNKNTDNHGQPTFTWSTLFCPYYSHTVSS